MARKNQEIILENVADGVYNINATVKESDKYYASNDNFTFRVVKYNAEITDIIIPVEDIIVGHNASITVHMGNITTGTLIIEVNN